MPLVRSYFIIIILLLSGISVIAHANDTIPGIAVDPELEAIFNSKVPREYTIAGITTTGSAAFDTDLLVSITGISVGDKVYLPGGDVFAKAIQALWKQQYFDDAAIYITRIEDKNIFI
jgi:outer membrane protein insertion porin family